MDDIEKAIEKQEEIISYFRTIISPTDFEQKARDVLAVLKEKQEGTELCERCGRRRLKSAWEGR